MFIKPPHPWNFHSLTHQTLLHVLPPRLPFLDLKRLSTTEEMTPSLGSLILQRTGVQFPVFKCCGSQQHVTPALGDPTHLLASVFIHMFLQTHSMCKNMLGKCLQFLSHCAYLVRTTFLIQVWVIHESPS